MSLQTHADQSTTQQGKMDGKKGLKMFLKTFQHRISHVLTLHITPLQHLHIRTQTYQQGKASRKQGTLQRLQPSNTLWIKEAALEGFPAPLVKLANVL
jgi:hypothetical protein